MLILLSNSTGNIAHIDSVNSEGGALSIYSSLAALFNSEAPLSTQVLKVIPNEYEAMTLYASDLLGSDWVVKSVVGEDITDPPVNLPVAAVPRPDWIAFYDTILITTAFQSVRTQALSSLPLTLAVVEFSAAVSDAKAGRPNLPAIGAAIGNIMAVATLSPEELTQLYQAGVNASLPDELLALLNPA